MAKFVRLIEEEKVIMRLRDSSKFFKK